MANPSSDPNFNLLDEAWIPALYHNGEYKRVGIHKALEDAHTIRQIAASNPMDRVAILRFFLALLYWCRGNPPNDSAEMHQVAFPKEWFNKLLDHRESFNLLGEEKRFMQYADAKRVRPSTDLIQEIPTGNNFWHFKHSTDLENGLCPACCALGLLRLPLYSVVGLSGPGSPPLKSGINGTPPIYIVPNGRSLLDTLILNWASRDELGIPFWEDSNIIPSQTDTVPLLLGLTIPGRKVFLHEPTRPEDRCIACGSIESSLIRTCEYQTAGVLESEHWNDPHVLYSNDTPRKRSRAEDLLAAGYFRMDKPWPRLLTRLMESGKFSHPERHTTISIVGFATDKAKYIDVWERNISIPPIPNTEYTIATVTAWNDAAIKLPGRLSARAKSVEVKSAVNSIRPHVEHKVSARMKELLSGEEHIMDATGEYTPMLRAIAASISPGYRVQQVRRRMRIADTVPTVQLSNDTNLEKNT